MSNKRKSSVSDEEPSLKQQKIDDGKYFKMYFSPLPMKDLAALKIALAIWRHHKICFSKHHGYGSLHYNNRRSGPNESYVYVPSYSSLKDYDADRNPLMKWIETSIEELLLPRPIEVIVTYHCKIIERELRYWACYHKNLISLESVDITNIVWKSDRYIDYLATTRSMLLSSSRFTSEERFMLMSTYCLENEMESLPTSILHSKFMNNLTPYRNGMQFYWMCYLRNELSRVMGTAGYYTSINSYMLLINAKKNEASMEYFFNRLNHDEIDSATVSLINSFNFNFTSILLSKLDESQHHQVLVKCVKSIIIDLGRSVAYENYVSAVWINYKEFITESDFYQIIYSLFKLEYVDEGNTDHVDRLLCDIWDTATVQMMEYVWRNRFVNFLKYCGDSCVNSVRWIFLQKMLSDASVATKTRIVQNPIFVDFCISSIKTYQWYRCIHFIKLCLPIIDQIVQFKNQLTNTDEIKGYCRKLIKAGAMDKLDDLLVTYLPDTDNVFILEYKKKLLNSEITLKVFCIAELLADRVGKSIEFAKYILPDPEAAADFRKKLALDSKIVELMSQYVNKGRFSKTKALLDELLARTEDFEPVKMNLLSVYKTILRSGKCLQLKKVDWDAFLPWCSESAKEILWKSLRVYDIFLKMLKTTVFEDFKNQEFKDEMDFEELDYFLSCYFDTKEEIHQYKINLIYEYRRIKLIEVILKNTMESASLKLVVEWFFDKNQRLIDDFAEKYSLDTSKLLF